MTTLTNATVTVNTNIATSTLREYNEEDDDDADYSDADDTPMAMPSGTSICSNEPSATGRSRNARVIVICPKPAKTPAIVIVAQPRRETVSNWSRAGIEHRIRP